MTEKEYLLVKLAEECVETAQRATKALTFGLDEIQKGQSLTNAERIVYEFNDIMTIMLRLRQLEVFKEIINDNMCQLKMKKIDKYMDYSRSLGIID